MFRLYPRGMELFPHRIEATTNFGGTIAHELTHLIQAEFEEEWGEDFQWRYCWQDEYKDEWEVREPPVKTPLGEKKWFHKESGWMSPQGQFPLQPDKCVTNYARQNIGEDICESMVAYLHDPGKLRAIAQKKHQILQGHDAKQETPEVEVQQMAENKVKLPEIKPQTIYYYIEEPKEGG